MAISYMNTIKVQDVIDEMSSLINDFDFIIDSLFTRFSEVSNVTKEWVGNQSEYYFSRVALDKNDYIAFSNDLKKIKDKIQYDMDSVQKRIDKNKINESE